MNSDGQARLPWIANRSIEFNECCEVTLLEPASDCGVAQIDQRLFKHTATRKRLDKNGRATHGEICSYFAGPLTLHLACAFLDKMRSDELSVSPDVAIPKRIRIHIMKVLMSSLTRATLRCVRLHPSRGRHVSSYLTSSVVPPCS